MARVYIPGEQLMTIKINQAVLKGPFRPIAACAVGLALSAGSACSEPPSASPTVNVESSAEDLKAMAKPLLPDEPPSIVNKIVVHGEAPRIDAGTVVCVSAEVAVSGLDEAGVNAASNDSLAGFLQGHMNVALRQHGQAKHMPGDESRPRVVRDNACGPSDVRLRLEVTPRSNGGPYEVRLSASKNGRIFVAKIARDGLVRAQPGVPVLPGDKLPDGRSYWDLITDCARLFESVNTATTWLPTYTRRPAGSG